MTASLYELGGDARIVCRIRTQFFHESIAVILRKIGLLWQPARTSRGASSQVARRTKWTGVFMRRLSLKDFSFGAIARRLVQSGASRWLGGVYAIAVVSLSAPCRADHLTLHTLLEDGKLYVTAPVRWDRQDWLYFGGALAAIGTAHEYDDSVRAHFTAGPTHPLDGKDPEGLRDAAPAAAVFVATWGIRDTD